MAEAPTIDPGALWERVEHLCELRGYSMRGLSLHCGLPAQSITLWKYKGRLPDVAALYCIADTLSTTMEYLVSGREPRALKLSGTTREVVEAVRDLTIDEADCVLVLARGLARRREG